MATVSYLSRFSPLRAWRDLRMFLSYRQPHELLFLVAAILITGIIITGFYFDSRIERPYERPEIMYFESWPESRTDDQIKAQQAIDKIEQDKRMALLKQKQEERKAEFKRLNDKLESWGL